MMISMTDTHLLRSSKDSQPKWILSPLSNTSWKLFFSWFSVFLPFSSSWLSSSSSSMMTRSNWLTKVVGFVLCDWCCALSMTRKLSQISLVALDNGILYSGGRLSFSCPSGSFWYANKHPPVNLKKRLFGCYSRDLDTNGCKWMHLDLTLTLPPCCDK